jgi:hypothetical protein
MDERHAPPKVGAPGDLPEHRAPEGENRETTGRRGDHPTPTHHPPLFLGKTEYVKLKK